MYKHKYPTGDSGGWGGACEEEVDGEAQPRPAEARKSPPN